MARLLAVLAALLAAVPAATAGADCPPPAQRRGSAVWYRGSFAPPVEVPSPTACETAGGELVVIQRKKGAGVAYYVCAVERLFQGPEIEAELSAARPAEVARRRVPRCPLGGRREVEVLGPPGRRSLKVNCVARVAPGDWCTDRRAEPEPHGRGCFRPTCPPGREHVDFRGSDGACIACPAGATDLRETLRTNAETFGRASGYPFVSPAAVTWLCRADAAERCR